MPGDRVVRGGSFTLGEGHEDFGFLDCTTVMRTGRDVNARPEKLSDVGFRCAKSIDLPEAKPEAEKEAP